MWQAAGKRRAGQDASLEALAINQINKWPTDCTKLSSLHEQAASWGNEMKIKMRTPSTHTHTQPAHAHTHTHTFDRQPLDSSSVSSIAWPSGRPQNVSVVLGQCPWRRPHRCHVSQSTNQATNQAACDMQLKRACPACSTPCPGLGLGLELELGLGLNYSACQHNFKLVCSLLWCAVG